MSIRFWTSNCTEAKENRWSWCCLYLSIIRTWKVAAFFVPWYPACPTSHLRHGQMETQAGWEMEGGMPFLLKDGHCLSQFLTKPSHWQLIPHYSISTMLSSQYAMCPCPYPPRTLQIPQALLGSSSTNVNLFSCHKNVDGMKFPRKSPRE